VKLAQSGPPDAFENINPTNLHKFEFDIFALKSRSILVRILKYLQVHKPNAQIPHMESRCEPAAGLRKSDLIATGVIFYSDNSWLT